MDKRLKDLYTNLGKVISKDFSISKRKDSGPTRQAVVLTEEKELSLATGLQAARTNVLFNGPVRCILAQFGHVTDSLDSPAQAPTPTQDQEGGRPQADTPAPGRKTPAGSAATETADQAGSKAAPNAKAPAGGRQETDSAVPSASNEGKTDSQTELSENANFLLNRLRKNQVHLKKYLKNNNITCYRVYDADIPEYNAAIDIYQNRWAHIQEYQAPREIPEETARRRLEETVEVTRKQFSLQSEDIYVKHRRKMDRRSQYEKQAETGEFHTVEEGGLKFLVNFRDYLDTGIFLDHRITRSMIRELASGLNFLNLFCYTGTATVYAASGGAAYSTSIDTSNTYLDWARRNMDLNELSSDRHRFIRADALSWLQQPGEKFDLMFIDPPTFSNNKSEGRIFDIQKDHVLLLRFAMQRLNPNGAILFSTNFRKFQPEFNSVPGSEAEEITKNTIPEDFHRKKKIHRSFLIRKAETE